MRFVASIVLRIISSYSRNFSAAEIETEDEVNNGDKGRVLLPALDTLKLPPAPQMSSRLLVNRGVTCVGLGTLPDNTFTAEDSGDSGVRGCGASFDMLARGKVDFKLPAKR